MYPLHANASPPPMGRFFQVSSGGRRNLRFLKVSHQPLDLTRYNCLRKGFRLPSYGCLITRITATARASQPTGYIKQIQIKPIMNMST